MQSRWVFAAVVGLGFTAPSALWVRSARAAEEPTAFEQYELELLNRARANPSAEVQRLSGMTWGDDPNQVQNTQFPQPQTPSLNEGLPAGTISADAKQPLAFNTQLIQAARDYSQTLIANSQFTHTYNNTDPQGRMQAAGYTFSPTPAGAGENLAATGGSGSEMITTAIAEQHHDNLFIDNNEVGRGHRLNMMNPSWREVGIGLAQGTTTIFGSSFPTVLTTQDFAFKNTNPFLTGVVYNDNVTKDNFYTPGEGIGGATITAVPIGGGSPAVTTTFGSGGYTLQLAPGTYAITAAGTFGIESLGNITISGANVKLDAVNPVPEPAGLGLLALAAGPAFLRRRRRAVSC